MVDQFDHRFGTFGNFTKRPPKGASLPSPSVLEKRDSNYEIVPWYWVSQDQVRRRVGTWKWARQWLLGFRDVTNSTNERTVIVSLIPGVAANNKLPLIFTTQDTQGCATLIANLNCLVLDYVARQKIGGTSLGYFYLKQLPVIPPSLYSLTDLAFITPRVLELTYTSCSITPFARALGYKGDPFSWDGDRRALLRAELDAWYARAYGLSRNDLRYILDPKKVLGEDYPSETFRVLQSNERKHLGYYRTERLVLAAWDRQAAGDVPESELDQLPPIISSSATFQPTNYAELPNGAWANVANCTQTGTQTHTVCSRRSSGH